MATKNGGKGKMKSHIIPSEFLERRAPIIFPDTNVFIANPDAAEQFGDSIVVISFWVIDELDGLKVRDDSVGISARRASRNIEDLRGNIAANMGAPTKKGGLVYVDISGGGLEDMPIHPEKTPDHKIISAALGWRKRYSSLKVRLISKDVIMRTKARSFGLEAEDYESDRVVESMSDLYNGFESFDLPPGKEAVITELYRTKRVSAALLLEASQISSLLPNQCVKLNMPDNSRAERVKEILALFKTGEGKSELQLVEKIKPAPGKVRPRNTEQYFLHALLNDPGIDCIFVTGATGSGKTLIPLLVGWEQLDRRFNQIVIFRPIVEVGASLGFLPGTLEEKLAPWNKPIIQNLRLISGCKDADLGNEVLGSPDKINGFKGTGRNGKLSTADIVREYVNTEKIQFETIAHCRGQSIHYSLILVDDAQQLTRVETDALLTRVGIGSVIVFAGDFAQIDRPYLRADASGLCFEIEDAKGDPGTGRVHLIRCERSPLVQRIIERRQRRIIESQS
jgi:PhoH-like ATPase